MGRSFHWMDRAETLRRLDALIEPGGAVVLFDEEHPDVPDNAWLAEYRDPARAIRQRRPRCGPVRQSADWVGTRRSCSTRPFRRLERIGVIERRRVPSRAARRSGVLAVEHVAGPARGRGRSARRGDRRLHGRRVAPDGLATEIVESTAIVARRPIRGTGLPDQGDRAVTRRDAYAAGIRGHTLAKEGRICEIAAIGTDR